MTKFYTVRIAHDGERTIAVSVYNGDPATEAPAAEVRLVAEGAIAAGVEWMLRQCMALYEAQQRRRGRR